MRRTLQGKQFLPLLVSIVVFCFTSEAMRATVANGSLTDRSKQVQLRSIDRIKLAPTLGNENLLADFVWLDFVQFLGGSNSSQPNFVSSTTSYLDELVRLDPSFVEAYYFAAIVLGGDCKRPDLAAKFITVGLNKMPTDWRLPYIAGVNQFLYAHDSGVAAKFYLQASCLPGAPYWLRGQSQILAANIPEIIKQINVWDNLYSEAANVPFRQMAKDNLCALWLKVYKEAPSKVIKSRAIKQLFRLGVDVHQSAARN